MSFQDRVRKIQFRSESLLCVGLDIDPREIPVSLRATQNPTLEFAKQIIDATADLVCAYKINIAFFEAEGAEGWNNLEALSRLIPPNLLKIGDAKRGDIGNTSERYARAFFDKLNFNAVTVNPYMGYDSVEPFLKDNERGAFILALTSNAGSRDFQRLKVGKKPLYEKVVNAASRWNSNKNVGLVVGATHARELGAIRKLVPMMPILIPGVGKQGGDLRSAVRYGCTKSGDLAIINASRSVLYASSGKDFAEASRRESLRLRDAINNFREEFFLKPTKMTD